MAEFDYEVVNGRKIRVRPVETVSEVDENGYFVRQPNHFTEGFGEGKNPVEAGRYRLVWAKLCHWSNRASIVRELLGLDEAISVNMVDHAEHEKNLGWEFVYDKDNVDPVLDIQFLSEAYYKADDDYTGRTTVPALIDVKTGKVVNNDYHRLTNYFEVDFKPFHKKNAPDLYPEELRKDIDEMNDWLFDNINNGVYKTTFCRSKEAYWDAYNSFYAAMDLLEERLENRRFLFGDYVTDSDVRLYVTLARLDIRYTHQLGHTKRPLFTYKNLWAYARDLYQIPAFKNNTYFKDFANPDNKKQGRTFESFNARFLDEIDFDAYTYVGDDNETTGYDVEVLKEVFDRLDGYDLQIEVTDIPSVFSGVTSGTYQIGVNNFSYNEERAKSYLYSYPYDKIGYVFITKKGAPEVKTFADAAGKSFEGQSGVSVTTAIESWNEKNPDKKIDITYTDADTAITLQHIEDGTTDLAIIDVAMYNAYQKEYNYDVVANQISDEDAKAIADNSYAYYIFPKDQEELRDKVDEQLKELKKDGTLSKLSQKYFGQDTAPEDDQFEKTPN